MMNDNSDGNTDDGGFEVGRAIVGCCRSKEVEAKDCIDDHDEEQQAKHVKDGGQTLEHLPQKPPDPSAEVCVHHKEHS